MPKNLLERLTEFFLSAELHRYRLGRVRESSRTIC